MQFLVHRRIGSAKLLATIDKLPPIIILIVLERFTPSIGNAISRDLRVNCTVRQCAWRTA